MAVDFRIGQEYGGGLSFKTGEDVSIFVSGHTPGAYLSIDIEYAPRVLNAFEYKFNLKSRDVSNSLMETTGYIFTPSQMSQSMMTDIGFTDLDQTFMKVRITVTEGWDVNNPVSKSAKEFYLLRSGFDSGTGLYYRASVGFSAAYDAYPDRTSSFGISQWQTLTETDGAFRYLCVPSAGCYVVEVTDTETIWGARKVTVSNSGRKVDITNGDGDFGYLLESGWFDFAIDGSKNQRLHHHKTIDMFNYVPLSCYITDVSPSKFTVSGSSVGFQYKAYDTYGNYTWTDHNVTIKYRFTSNEETGAWQTAYAPVTAGDDVYAREIEPTIDITTEGKNIFIEVEVEDKFGVIKRRSESLLYKPTFDWGYNDFKFNVPVFSTSSLTFNSDAKIYGSTTYGDPQEALVPCDSIGNLTLGYGGYRNESGSTKIYGDTIDLIANHGITVNGMSITGGGGEVLWSGASQLGADENIYFTDSNGNVVDIADLQNGIVLIFSLFRNNSAENVSINSFFVSKKEIELLPDAPHTFMMNINAGFSGFGAKYVYIDRTNISGHSGNTSSGSNSGVTYNNSQYVLRYVIGV